MAQFNTGKAGDVGKKVRKTKVEVEAANSLPTIDNFKGVEPMSEAEFYNWEVHGTVPKRWKKYLS